MLAVVARSKNTWYKEMEAGTDSSLSLFAVKQIHSHEEPAANC